jgi:trehalose 6-phosphate synthase
VTADRRRLIVVSNRGPISYTRDEHGRSARRGGGGLVTALASLVSLHDVTWIANAMTDEDRAVAREAHRSFDETGRDGSSYRLRLVEHGRGDFDRFYNEFANPALWFLQHDLWSSWTTRHSTRRGRATGG